MGRLYIYLSVCLSLSLSVCLSLSLSGQIKVVSTRLIIYVIYHFLYQSMIVFQASRRVVESGPAEVSGECRRHERGIPPLVRGLGDLPDKMFELSTPVRAF